MQLLLPLSRQISDIPLEYV